MPLLPFGEYKPDVADYETTATQNIVNALPRGDGYGPFPSPSNFTAALPSACRGAFYAINADGSVTIFAGTANKLYMLSNTTYTWTDVSNGGGTYASVSPAYNWDFVQTGSLV